MKSYRINIAKANSYIGRYHEVRGFYAKGATPPLILDRCTGRMSLRETRFWLEEDGCWYPAICGGVGGLDTLFDRERMTPIIAILNVALQNTSINSAYTYNSAGACYAGRYRGPAKTLNSIYFRLNLKTGTIPGNDLDWEIRDSSGNNKPGSTIQSGGSGTIDITSITAPSWISASSLSVSLSANTNYYACLADKSAVDGSNFATMTRASNWITGAKDTINSDGCNSTNGFSTRSDDNRVPNIVWGFSDNTSFGDPFISNTAGTSNTERRGVYFSAGFASDVKFFGMGLNSTHTNVSGLEIYPSSATTPGSGQLSIGTVGELYAQALVTGNYLVTPYVFSANTPYRVVFTYSGNSNSFSTYDIGVGADSTLARAMWGGGTIYYSRANGTTNWANDSIYAFPRGYIFLENQVTAASGTRGFIIGG